MQQKCKNCGEIYNIEVNKYFKMLLARKFLCKTCEDINKWKENTLDYENQNYYTWGECKIQHYDFRLYNRIEEEIIRPKKNCEIKLKFEEIYHCFPIELLGDYLLCCKDELENGVHRSGDMEKRIPINYILGIKLLDIYRDYVEPDIEKPVFGFKGVCLTDGILKSKDYIYEIGIPYEEPQRNPYYTDYQDVYSHFCHRIEDVLLNYRDFITSPMLFSQGKGHGEERLFLVKGEGHCFQNTAYGWVSNKLTLIREVSKEEIIKYFNKRLKLKLKTEKHFIEQGIENVWVKYEQAEIKPYKQFMSNVEIENLLIQNCNYYKLDHCPQDNLEL